MPIDEILAWMTSGADGKGVEDATIAKRSAKILKTRPSEEFLQATPLLIKALRYHIGSLEICGHVLDILIQVSYNEATRLAAKDSIHECFAIVRIHKGNELVCEKALRTLTNLSQNATCHADIFDAGGISTIGLILTTSLSSFTITDLSIVILFNLVILNKRIASSFDQIILQSIVDVLRLYRSKLNTSICAFQILQVISESKPEVIYKSLGGRNLWLSMDALRTHRMSDQLCIPVIKLLGNFTITPPSGLAELYVQEGMIPILMDVLRQHRVNNYLCKVVLFNLVYLSNTEVGLPVLSETAGLATELVTCLRIHSQSVTVQTSVSEIIETLASRGPEKRDAMVREGVVESLVAIHNRLDVGPGTMHMTDALAQLGYNSNGRPLTQEARDREARLERLRLFNVPRTNIVGSSNIEDVQTLEPIPNGADVIRIIGRTGRNTLPSTYLASDATMYFLTRDGQRMNIRTQSPFTTEQIQRGPYRHRELLDPAEAERLEGVAQAASNAREARRRAQEQAEAARRLAQEQEATARRLAQEERQRVAQEEQARQQAALEQARQPVAQEQEQEQQPAERGLLGRAYNYFTGPRGGRRTRRGQRNSRRAKKNEQRGRSK